MESKEKKKKNKHAHTREQQEEIGFLFSESSRTEKLIKLQKGNKEVSVSSKSSCIRFIWKLR